MPGRQRQRKCYKTASVVKTAADLLDVEAIDARGGRAPDPRDDGKESHRRQTGQYEDRNHLRQMRRAQPPAGRKRRDPRQVRLQAVRPQARDALGSMQTVTKEISSAENSPTGKSAISCPAPSQKIFRFRRRANQRYQLARLAPTGGAYRDRHGRRARDAV